MNQAPALKQYGSHFRMVSLATVAEDKNDGSIFISAYPREAIPFHEGAVTDAVVTLTRTGVDAEGKHYSINLQRGMCVKAGWLKDGNRITAPNVRKGEQVELYEAGNTNIYYWKEMGRDAELRRTESVTHAWNANGGEVKKDEAQTTKNSYTATVDTKSGHATFTTSKANKEKAAYTIQLNGKLGHATLTDDNGNFVQINSVTGAITARNHDGSYVSLLAKTATVYASDKIFAVSDQQITATAPKLNLNGEVTITGTLKVTGNTELVSDVKVGGNTKLAGNLDIAGSTHGQDGHFN